MMDILITTAGLSGRDVMEASIRDHALALMRAGHRPMVYASMAQGAIADELRASGIPVAAHLAKLPAAPQVIHGQFARQTRDACAAFPHVPALYVVHDPLDWHNRPLLLPQVRRYVAVGEQCLRRIYLEGIPDAQVRVIRHAVDLRRFVPRPALPTRPSRALVYSTDTRETAGTAAIREACQKLGLPLDTLSEMTSTLSEAPERVLPGYDLVFASGCAAMEAAAVGAAVVLAGASGIGGMLTSANLDARLRWNLGTRVMLLPHHPEILVREIENYDAADAAAVSQSVRARCGLGEAIHAWIALYREVLAEPMPGKPLKTCREITSRPERRELVGHYTPAPASVPYPLPNLYFLHVPKTAGSSFRAHLSALYPPHLINPAQHWDQFFGIPRQDMARCRLHMGHFYYPFTNYLPEKLLIVTFQRDPIARVLSRYAHCQRFSHCYHPNAGQGLSLVEFLRDPVLGRMAGRSSLFYYGWDFEIMQIPRWPLNLLHNGSITESLWREQAKLSDAECDRMLDVALERLRGFAFVGLQERYDESLALLSHTMGWPAPAAAPRINVAPNARRQPLTDEETALLAEVTRHDRALYDEAVRLFDERVNSTLSQSQVVT
jgi:hypothetical protein